MLDYRGKPDNDIIIKYVKKDVKFKKLQQGLEPRRRRPPQGAVKKYRIVIYEDDIFRQPLRRMTVREGRKACFLDTKELCVQKAALIKK